MSESDRERWNERYAAGDYDLTPNPRLVTHLTGRIKPGMVALDLACGPGRNSLWLAAQGAVVQAWDISSKALAQLRAEAERQGLTSIQTREVDLELTALPTQAFDLIVVAHFLHRPLLLPLLDSLRPGGLLFLDTFLDSDKRSQVTPTYKLDPGELARVYGERAEMLYLHEDFPDGRAVMLARRPNP